MPTKPPSFQPPTHATSTGAGNDTRDEARRFRSTWRWTTFSARFRRIYPFCLDPFEAHRFLTPTEHAHHVHHLRSTLEHATNPSHVIPVCRACHDRIEPMRPDAMPPRVVRWRDDDEFRNHYWEAERSMAAMAGGGQIAGTAPAKTGSAFRGDKGGKTIIQ